MVTAISSDMWSFIARFGNDKEEIARKLHHLLAVASSLRKPVSREVLNLAFSEDMRAELALLDDEEEQRLARRAARKKVLPEPQHFTFSDEDIQESMAKPLDEVTMLSVPEVPCELDGFSLDMDLFSGFTFDKITGYPTFLTDQYHTVVSCETGPNGNYKRIERIRPKGHWYHVGKRTSMRKRNERLASLQNDFVNYA